jgi:hypothetical protein
MASDPFAHEDDLDVARQQEAMVKDSELFLYRGDRHLFADSSLAVFDEAASALLKQGALGFIDRIE